MKILLLGGTGAIGTQLSEALFRKGLEIVVTTRRSRSPTNSIEYMLGDAHDPIFLKRVLESQKWDVIVDFMVYSTTEFEIRLRTLLDSTDQYIFLSTSRVYAASSVPIVETSPRLLDVSNDRTFLSSDDYSLSKARQENLLENSGSKNWTIIRPYITYGRYRLQLGVLEKEEWLFRALGGRTVILSSAMQQKITTMTHGHDVANGIAALVGQQSAYGNIFHITNAQSYSWKEVYEMYAQAFKKVTGKELRICLADANTFFLTRPTIYQIEYDRMFDRHFNNSKISAYVDVGGFIDLCLGIEQEMKRFIEEPQFENIYWKLEARKDRFLKEKTRFSEIPGFLNKGRYFAFRYLAI